MKIVEVTPANVQEEGFYCLKNQKNPGFSKKRAWYEQRYSEGLRLKILKDQEGAALGFIEYVPAEFAWRPVEAYQYLFIHCIFVYPRKNQNSGNGRRLIAACEADARRQGKAGLAVMVSAGSWMADKRLFLRNGFSKVDQRGRFELLAKKFVPVALTPCLKDWTLTQGKYQGWHLVYADQCPLHQKSVEDLQATAGEHGIKLTVTRLTTALEAQNAPSGFGVYSLLHNGKLLEDHYISQTRFRNILKKELA